ncbi:hypothetical protein KIW84_015379 [Lathyrus oleraceus]|uniref:Uncharacterized protein n=1 Tax=Pisum sativum TaxID=3888 RepID=A0A9D5BQL0_PEA|nr:hypothetical protein KIW84_015379 [Pisum sativum]
MGRGWPRKKAMITPSVSVRVFSKPPSSHSSEENISVRDSSKGLGDDLLRQNTIDANKPLLDPIIEVDVTIEPKENITIRDPKGGKKIQPVEYEWRPSFCTICNKVGHECKQREHNKEKNHEKDKKIWAPKMRTTREVEDKRDNFENLKETENEKEEPSWTTVKTTSKEKGPKGNEDVINCTNVFEALRTGECSTSNEDKVP